MRVRHDPQRIGQVVANLLGNAIKFTPAGGMVSLTLEPHRDGARLEVRDTGVGIDASEVPHIFERFYRGSRANEARGSGSGLGLAIVKSIVDMHGGRISVESRVGQGTTFTVILLRDPKAAVDASAPDEAAAVSSAPGDAADEASAASSAPGDAPAAAPDEASAPREGPGEASPGGSPA